MVNDVDLALAYVARNLDGLGGDGGNVTLMGQSAGAHLSLLSLLRATITAAVDAQRSPGAPSLVMTPGLSLPRGVPCREQAARITGAKLSRLACDL
jgi:para-nitrobenzyl esterase